MQAQFKRRRRHRDTAERLAVDYLIILRLRRAIGTLAETLPASYKHLSTFPRSTTHLAINDGRGGTKSERKGVLSRATTSTLRLILMLVDIDVRHPSCFKSPCTSHVRRARCVTFNLPSHPFSLHIVSRGPSCVYLSLALVTNFAAQKKKNRYFNRRYTF